MSNAESKVCGDDGAIQQISGHQEAALLDADVIYLAEENLGVLHYKIASGKTWADVDAVIARG